MVNHFEGQSQISEKDNLISNLQKYCEVEKKNVFSFHPVTFIIDLESKHYQLELDRFNTYFGVLEKFKKDYGNLAAVN